MRPILALALAACVPQGGEPADDDPTARDIAEYNELAAKLDKRRMRFAGEEADELQPGARRIFWLRYGGFDPTIHSSLGGASIDYQFGAGTEGNLRVSDDLVVTATDAGDVIHYRAYDANRPGAKLGEISLAAPTDEQRWWAYAVDRGTVYIVTTGAQTTVHRWVPGTAPVAFAVLEQHGVAVGIFLDLMVHRDRMLFIESGRLWSFDLATRTATWLGNDKQITGGVSTNGVAVLYTQADGPRLWHNGTTREIDAEIDDSAYRLNPTFAAIHHHAGHAVLHKNRVIYKGQSGMFAYNLDTREVTPLLLEPRSPELRIVYTDPQITDDTGTLYVTGLESTAGAVGADGPVYTLALSAP